jgi:hypothetical protein
MIEKLPVGVNLHACEKHQAKRDKPNKKQQIVISRPVAVSTKKKPAPSTLTFPKAPVMPDLGDIQRKDGVYRLKNKDGVDVWVAIFTKNDEQTAVATSSPESALKIIEQSKGE